MQSEGRIKLIVAGLVLAAFAVGYFILAQRIQTTPVLKSPAPKASSSATPNPSSSPAPKSLPKSGTTSLPNTGFPVTVFVSGASSVMALGWYLRKYPR